MTSGPLCHVVHVPAARIATHREAWADLARRSLDESLFLDPCFALPAVRSLPGEDGVDFLLAFRRDGDDPPVLVGLLALAPQRFPRGGLAIGWLHRHACLGAPLLDRAHASAALDALLGWLTESRPGVAALRLPMLHADGATVALVEDVARARGLHMRRHDARHRPMFTAPAVDRLSPPRKRVQQAMRALARRGAVTYTSTGDGADFDAAVDAFLALEAAGWKGRAGTALAQDGGGAFARAALSGMGPAHCRIDALRLDGRSIAMGVLLRGHGPRAFFWKIAYDETLASLSPGLQFVHALMQSLASGRDIETVDSCASSDNAMIHAVWPERLAIVDVMIAPGPARNAAFDRAMHRHDALRRWRDRLRRWLRVLRARAGG